MIRILQVLGSLQRGGAETMIMNVYKKIDREKVQFDFLVKEHTDSGYEQDVKNLGGRIFCVESARKIGIFKYIKELTSVMKNNGPYDIIHSHVNTLSGLILFAAKKANIKVRISHSHTTKQDNKILKKMIALFATNRIACGQDAGKALFGKASFTIIPNGISMDNFLTSQNEQKELKKTLNIDDTAISICHIGRFVEVKNHIFIVELAEKLKENDVRFQLYLLGDGPLYENIKNLINTNGLNNYIKLVGSVPNANEYLKACDLFILPSLYEGLPVTLIESQCTGTYSIVSDNISKEADFDLNLVKFLPLNIDKWVEYIKRKKHFHKLDKDIVENRFIQKKYDINVSSKMLLDYYINARKNTKGEKNV